ncbi:Kelch repeat-containing protein [Alteromonas halophila]|uniref:Galactose oxidase n=1 Tax=Alteromonas halophila TaxID=516698 RepID=A0A918N084_9ALTE|nr:kelch repeat-containing protein [Alteromonas halophila]GGW92874.1 hypothetical protein GCM10007391_28900 [Alteromonas halophila]
MALAFLPRCSVAALVSLLLITACASSPEPANKPSTLHMARYGHAAVADDEHIYVFGGGGERGFLSSVEMIDPDTREVTLLSTKILPRRYLTAVWDGEESVFLLGGHMVVDDELRYVATVEVFNTTTHEITSTTPMRVPRSFNSAAKIGDKLIVAGGTTTVPKRQGEGLTLLATPFTTAFDLQNKTWSRLANLRVPRNTKVVAVNETICAMGGYNGFEQFATIECYDAPSDTWRSLPDAPAPFSAHSLIAYQEDVYVFGDYNDMDRVMKVNMKTNTWSYPTSDYQASRHNVAVVFGDEVFVIGGNTGTQGAVLDTIQVFTLPLAPQAARQ